MNHSKLKILYFYTLKATFTSYNENKKGANEHTYLRLRTIFSPKTVFNS